MQSYKSEKPCPSCGEVDFHTSYSGLEGKRMAQTGECFNCAFWEIKAQEKHDVVIDGRLYGIGKEPGRCWRRQKTGQTLSPLCKLLDPQE